MTKRYLLFIDVHRLSAYRWRSGRTDFEARFSPDPAGLQDFADYLAQRRSGSFHVLAEHAEQGFQQEDIPYVRGRDRLALLARKLDQYFYGVQLTVALSLGREPTGRRYEKLLFAALTGRLPLEPWLGLLCRAEAQIAGIYTLPLLATALAAKVGDTAPLLLLLTLTSGGLHQTLFKDRHLRFSRLTTLATDNLEDSAAACAAEAVKIHQYLVAQRMVAHDASLKTMVLVHPGQLSYFRSHCRDTAEIKFTFADLLAESRERGVMTLPRDSCSEPFFLHLMASRPPRAQFANSALRRFYHLAQIRFALKCAGVAVLLAGMFFVGNQVREYTTISGDVGPVRRQIEDSGQHYGAVTFLQYQSV